VPLDKAALAGFGPMWLDLDLAVAVFHGGCRSSAGSYAGTVSTTGAADDKPDPATASQAAQKQ